MNTPGHRIDVVLNSLGIGGAERHTIALANALAEHGHAVRLIALAQTNGQANGQAPSHGRSAVVEGAVQLARRGPVDGRALMEFRRLVRRDPPQLTLTVNQYPLAFVVAATQWMPRAPILQIMHTIELPHADSALKRRLYPLLLRRPAALAYVCEMQRQHWRRQGITLRPDHCVHSGVDIDRFTPAPQAMGDETRRRLGLPPQAFVIGLCAVLRQEKRHDLLLNALAQLRKSGRQVHALLIGDGPERARIEADAAAQGVADALTITGYQHDVVPFIAAADCMCLVSDYEAFSLSILESMAMGKPVVATDAGAVGEQITHGANGLITPRGDAAALAHAIATLYDDSSWRRALGEQALNTVRTRFDARTMHTRFIRIVADLASGQAQPRRTPAATK